MRLLLPLTLLLAALPLQGSSNNAAWIDDIGFIARELPRAHVNPFTITSRAAFDAEAARLKEDVPSLSDDEVAVRMLRLVASIEDAHTALYGYQPARVPIEVRWFADGFFVVRATEMERDLIGLRLAAIDGVPIEEVLTAVAPIVSHENDAWLRQLAPGHFTAPATLHALGLIQSAAMAEFTFERAGGSTVNRVLTAVSPGSISFVEPLTPEQLPLYRRNLALNYWFEYIPSTGTLYIAYNRCQEMTSPAAAAFANELAAFAQSHPVMRLVLDLRNNPGGNSALAATLFTKTFAALPEIDDPDRFFAVIGPATFSSGVMAAITIREQTRGTLIGSDTGGKPNSFGNVKSFRTPRFGLTVQYSTQRYDLVPGDPPSVAPDVEVPITSLDYFAGRDPVLEHIVPRLPRRRGVRR